MGVLNLTSMNKQSYKVLTLKIKSHKKLKKPLLKR